MKPGINSRDARKVFAKTSLLTFEVGNIKGIVKDVQFKQGRSWGNGINYWKGCCFCKASGRKNRRQWTEMENSGRVSDRVDVFCGSLRWWNCHKRRVCDSFVGIILSCKHTKARPSLGLTNYYNTSFAFSLCMQVCMILCDFSYAHNFYLRSYDRGVSVWLYRDVLYSY